jgi:hypothetical protein
MVSHSEALLMRLGKGCLPTLPVACARCGGRDEHV